MKQNNEILSEAVTLPNGAVLGNRIAKSAMSENLAEADHAPNGGLVNLYSRWGGSGAGLLITGNVMVDGRQLGEPHNVVIENEDHVMGLRRWAQAAQKQGAALWMQINHPGRQAPRITSKVPVAPSAVPLQKAGMFLMPRAMTDGEIVEQVERFARTAAIAEQAGFAGVQVHGAHGYLVSQFLSPLTNKRNDRWGGSLENRMRFVVNVVRAIRAAVSPRFGVGVKLNSADFQRGGFTIEESMEVARVLEGEGLDLLEISGGTFEKPVMALNEREAYFIDYAARIRSVTTLPLMVTGGFRSAEVMANAVTSGAVDVIGMARPFAAEPDLPARLLSGDATVARDFKLRVGIKTLDGFLQMAWHQRQMHRMARGADPTPWLGRWSSIAVAVGDGMCATRRAA